MAPFALWSERQGTWCLHLAGILAAVAEPPSRGTSWRWKARPVQVSSGRLLWEREGIAPDLDDVKRQVEELLTLQPTKRAPTKRTQTAE